MNELSIGMMDSHEPPEYLLRLGLKLVSYGPKVLCNKLPFNPDKGFLLMYEGTVVTFSHGCTGCSAAEASLDIAAVSDDSS